jgi:hypothetical protein
VIGRYQSTWSTQVPRGRNQEDDDLDFDLDRLDPNGNQPEDDPADEPDPNDEPDEPEDDEIRAGDENEDDEPDDEPEDDDEPERRSASRQQDRRPQRRDDRIHALTTRNADLERRINELTTRVNQPPAQTRETPEQRAARLALMQPEDRIREELRESTEAHNGQMRAIQFQLQDTSDRASFDAKVGRSKLHARWADKVEEEYRKQQSGGMFVPREAIMYFLIGKAAVAAAEDPGNRQERRAAASRVRRQTTRPSNSRSDRAPSGDSRRSASLEKRLENVQL